MHTSVDIGLRVFTERVTPDSPVRCDLTVITDSPASANINIAPGGVQNTRSRPRQRLTSSNIQLL